MAEGSSDLRKGLTTLFKLGFTNFEVNKSVLLKTKCNVEEAVGQIVENKLSESTIQQAYKM